MRTKHDFGPCPHVHDDDLKAEWDALDDKNKDRLGFEKELYRCALLGESPRYVVEYIKKRGQKVYCGMDRYLLRDLKVNEGWTSTGIDKLMLELKAKIRRNEERLAADMAAPLILADDQVRGIIPAIQTSLLQSHKPARNN